MLTLVTALLLAHDGGVTLLFGGDIIPHTPIKTAAKKHGWGPMFAPLTGAFADADFVIVNMEAPVVQLKKPEDEEKVFWAPPELPRALASAGVDVAGFANNHCLDQHREGITSTRAFLADAGLRSFGCDTDAEKAWRPLVLEHEGLRVGLFGFTRFLNGFNNKPDVTLPHVPALQYDGAPIGGSKTVDDVLTMVRTYASQVDALIVYVHWGNEYQPAPRPQDRVLAAQLLDAGAFAVIGMHPHVLQPVEYVARADGGVGLVAFSLGNLLSNQDYGNASGLKRDELLLKLELLRTDAGVQLGAVTPLPATTEHLPRGRVQVSLVEDDLRAIDARLAALAEAKQDKKVRQEKLQLLQRKRVATARLKRIAEFTKAMR